MNLQEALSQLSKGDKTRLEYNFERCEPDYVRVAPDLWLGVFLDKVDHLEVVEQDGRWALAKRRASTES
jgi:hypothetical protein